jgi:hypothetical protein
MRCAARPDFISLAEFKLREDLHLKAADMLGTKKAHHQKR